MHAHTSFWIYYQSIFISFVFSKSSLIGPQLMSLRWVCGSMDCARACVSHLCTTSAAMWVIHPGGEWRGASIIWQQVRGCSTHIIIWLEVISLLYSPIFLAGCVIFPKAASIWTGWTWAHLATFWPISTIATKLGRGSHCFNRTGKTCLLLLLGFGRLYEKKTLHYKTASRALIVD